MKAISEIIPGHIDKQVIKYYKDRVQQVKKGEINPLDIATNLYEAKKSLDELYDEIKGHIAEERQKYSNKEDVVRNGYRIKTRQRVYPKYSQDDEYSFINEKLQARKKLIRKAINRGRPLIDSETGETVEPVDASYSTFPVFEWVGEDV